MNRTLPTLVIAAAVTAGLAGCGGSSSTSTSATAGRYPAAFAGAFKSACTRSSHGKAADCACLLSYIESNIKYTQMLKAMEAIEKGKIPSWYRDAASQCHITS